MSECWKCSDDIDETTETLKKFFVDMAQKGHIRRGGCPARRAVFRKPHGVAHGYFEVLSHVSKEDRTGILAVEKPVPFWARFSSDIAPDGKDLGGTIGLALKLFGIEGEKANGENGHTADLIFQNFSTFFVDTAKEFCEMERAALIERDFDGYTPLTPKPENPDVRLCGSCR